MLLRLATVLRSLTFCTSQMQDKFSLTIGDPLQYSQGYISLMYHASH